MVPAVTNSISGAPAGFAQVALSGAAQALPSIPAGATMAVIRATAAIAWRDDGVAPTATIGILVAANEQIIYAATLSAFQFIGSAGNVNVSYYK